MVISVRSSAPLVMLRYSGNVDIASFSMLNNVGICALNNTAIVVIRSRNQKGSSTNSECCSPFSCARSLLARHKFQNTIAPSKCVHTIRRVLRCLWSSRSNAPVQQPRARSAPDHYVADIDNPYALG